jgi:GNAT superfamily N-acetyltransferase
MRGSDTIAAVVSLQPIDDSNRGLVEALSVGSLQEQFVAGVAESLVEAVEDPGGRAIYWAIYADHLPVGFVMISDEVDGPDYIAQYLWRLLIDQRYQRRGYGAAALDLVVEYFRGRPGVEVMWTSCGEGEGSPLGFYERYGFEQTGDRVFDNEILLRLELAV